MQNMLGICRQKASQVRFPMVVKNFPSFNFFLCKLFEWERICLCFFIDSNFVLRYYALFFICICSPLSSLLIEIDFYEVRLELSTILEHTVCADR